MRFGSLNNSSSNLDSFREMLTGRKLMRHVHQCSWDFLPLGNAGIPSPCPPYDRGHVHSHVKYGLALSQVFHPFRFMFAKVAIRYYILL